MESKRHKERAVLRCTCPMCGRPQTALRGDWVTYAHKDPQTAEYCPGVDPEALFTAFLRKHNLDVREDAPQRRDYA